MAVKKKSGARKVKRAMHEMKRGKLKSRRSGRKVKSRKQAILRNSSGWVPVLQKEGAR